MANAADGSKETASYGHDVHASDRACREQLAFASLH